jgi:hypothetical protein
MFKTLEPLAEGLIFRFKEISANIAKKNKIRHQIMFNENFVYLRLNKFLFLSFYLHVYTVCTTRLTTGTSYVLGF